MHPRPPARANPRPPRSPKTRRTQALGTLGASLFLLAGCGSDMTGGSMETQDPTVKQVDCADGALTAALAEAGKSDAPTQLELAAGCTYHLLAPDNYWYGPTGLPPIQTRVIVNGHGATIERDGAAPPFRLLFVAGPPTPTPDVAGAWGLRKGSLTLRDVTLRGGIARGGDGGPQGGGGMGAGGGLFIQGDARLEGVTITGCRAEGGAGGAYSSGRLGGGGGMGGAGGGGGGGFKDAGSDMLGGGFLDGEGGSATGTGGKGQGAAAGASWDANTLGRGGGIGGLGARGRFAPDQPFGDGGSGGDLAGGGAGFGGAGGSAFKSSASSGGGGGGGFGGGGGRGLVDGRDSGGGGGVGGGGGGGDVGGGGGFGGGGGGAAYAGGDGGFGGGGGGGGGPDPMYAGTSALGGGAGGDGAGGGGLGAGGAVFVHLGSVTVVNSSLVENTAAGGSGGKGATTAGNAQGGSALGGGLFNLAGSVQLVHATLARNTVQAGTGRTPEAAGGAACNVGFGLKSTDGSESNGALTLRNSVLAGSQGGADLMSIRDMSHGAAQANTDGGGKNYVQAVTNRGATDTTVPQPADPMLGMLTVTGGPTATAAPLAGSPLIGAADPAVCSAEPARGIDQRGARRGDRCTLGAFESEPAPGSDIDMNTGTQPPADSGGCSTVPGRAPGAGGGLATLGLGAAVLLGLAARRRRPSGGHWTA